MRNSSRGARRLRWLRPLSTVSSVLSVFPRQLLLPAAKRTSGEAVGTRAALILGKVRISDTLAPYSSSFPGSAWERAVFEAQPHLVATRWDGGQCPPRGLPALGVWLDHQNPPFSAHSSPRRSLPPLSAVSNQIPARRDSTAASLAGAKRRIFRGFLVFQTQRHGGEPRGGP